VNVVRAGDLTVVVAPQFGAKVTSLRLAGGREWLAAPVRPYRRVSSPPVWADEDCSGWDECWPNIAAEDGIGLIDHGDVWWREWESVDSAGQLRTSVAVPDRYEFARTLRLAAVDGAATVTADYRLAAHGGTPLRWAWAQHPMLAADPAMRIVLPAPARVRVEWAFDRGTVGSTADWLCPGGMLEAETSLHRASGRAAKVWFDRPLPATVTLVHGADRLTYRVDRSTMPDLGLWVNLGGWGDGLAHVGVEPAFGAADRFADAQQRGAGPVLERGAEHSWRTVLELGRET
jgi:hypothetical protein